MSGESKYYFENLNPRNRRVPNADDFNRNEQFPLVKHAYCILEAKYYQHNVILNVF